MQPAPSAGKHATCAKRGKTRVRQVTIGFGFTSDWMKNQHVCSDWLERVQNLYKRLITK